MRRLGGIKGAREGAEIQWPIFPSFCFDDGRERVEGGRVEFDGEEKSLVNFDGAEKSVVELDGEEKSRACSVAGLG